MRNLQINTCKNWKNIKVCYNKSKLCCCMILIVRCSGEIKEGLWIQDKKITILWVRLGRHAKFISCRLTSTSIVVYKHGICDSAMKTSHEGKLFALKRVSKRVLS